MQLTLVGNAFSETAGAANGYLDLEQPAMFATRRVLKP